MIYGPFGENISAIFAAALEQGTDFELLSLHPMPYKATPENNFHGWKVLGRTSVTDNNVRNRLLAAFKGGVNAAEEAGADCFDPRHGIRVTADNQTIDVVICFDCEWVYTYVDNKRMESFTCNYTPQPEFDAILTSAGVELAPGG